jgi:protein SERAC1
VSGIELVSGKRPDALIDVIFVHGLGGNWKATWEFRSQPGKNLKPESAQPLTLQTETSSGVAAVNSDVQFWPEWIAAHGPAANVWALDYEANRSDWSQGMALSQHGEQALAILMANDFGKRPIIFVAHSLGGLLVKSLLQTSYDNFSVEHRSIAQATRGVVFFATPNSGSRLATHVARLIGALGLLGQIVRLSDLVRVLQANQPELLKLNRWYRDRVTDATSKGLKISTQVFYETRPTAFGLVSIVDASSADPGIGGVGPIPVAKDHFAICKLPGPDDWIFKSVVNFIKTSCQSDLRPGGDGPIIELVVPPNARSIRLVIDDNMIPSGNLTFRVTRSNGGQNE